MIAMASYVTFTSFTRAGAQINNGRPTMRGTISSLSVHT